ADDSSSSRCGEPSAARASPTLPMSPVYIAVALAAFFVGRFAWFRLRAKRARALVQQGAPLVDVRTAAEFAAGHLPGARNVPLAELASRARELGDKRQPLVVYCASGTRSALAALQLRGCGFEQVVNLGPMSGWRMNVRRPLSIDSRAQGGSLRARPRSPGG